MIHSDLDDALIADLGTRMDVMYADTPPMSDFDLRADQKPLDVYLSNTKRIHRIHRGVISTPAAFHRGKNHSPPYLEGQARYPPPHASTRGLPPIAYKAIGTTAICSTEGMAHYSRSHLDGTAF